MSIYKKMSDVMRDIGHVEKAQENRAQGFKFRGIDQFINALYPALVKHGVFISPECVSEKHEIREVQRSNGKMGLDKHVSLMMRYHFYADDGTFVTIGPIASEGLDSGDKATNKALSAALKYALIQTFAIPTEDMIDGDFDSPRIGFDDEVQFEKPVTHYPKAQVAPQSKPLAPPPLPKMVSAAPPMSRLMEAMKLNNWSKEQVKAYSKEIFGVESSDKLNDRDFEMLIETVRASNYDYAIMKVLDVK